MDYENSSDEALIESYRQGDEKAIEVLLVRYKHLVRKKARAMFLTGGDRDDLIQEGMIGLFEAVNAYSSNKEASFSTFAGICIKRQISTAVSASNRKKNSPLNNYVPFDMPTKLEDGSDFMLLDVLCPGAEQNPENLFIDEEYTEYIKKELATRLSSYEKQVFDLYMDGMDYLEISDILGKSPKSIDNALQRIRNKVRQILVDKKHML